jgi:hypothetical protein
MMTEIEVKRARLAAIERELSGLGARHDLAMSAFSFDEAREVQQRITILQRERAELVKALPAATPPPPAAPVPVMIRPRRPVSRGS